MAVWAYECRACRGEGTWLVAQAQVAEMPADVRLLRVRLAADRWVCAVLDRSQRLAVESNVLREALPADEHDCPDCAGIEPQAAAVPAPPAAAADDAGTAPGVELQGAAIALQGRRMLVVLVPVAVVRSSGEADMLSADLRPRFGGVDLVLMGQADDGSPEYHGPADLLALLADVPIDKMPWKTYPLR